MRKPGKAKPGKGTMERKQAQKGGSGINTPVKHEKVAQVDMPQRYGLPTQKQKM
jgi:hypothetical protein